MALRSVPQRAAVRYSQNFAARFAAWLSNLFKSISLKHPNRISPLYAVVLQPAFRTRRVGVFSGGAGQLVRQQCAGQALVGVLAAFGLHFHAQAGG